MTDPTLWTATQLAEAIQSGQVSAVQALEAYLARIERYNPDLNAIVTLDADGARRRAGEADAAVARGECWGALHGVPVTVKDVFATAGMRTTSGFAPMANYVPPHDATVVARLRAAGAILLGKTNTPQFASDAQTNNRVFGRTNNPWDLERTPGGGSSGGSAAAIAARLSALEVGSDIGGSLRTPAHFCGVFALKPTDLLVPWTGHLASPPGFPRGLLRSLVSIGPLARSVPDLRLALKLMAGPDDKQTEIPPVVLFDPPARGLSGLRIAWSDDLGGVPITSETRRAIQDLAQRLQAQGCDIVHADPPAFDFAMATRLRQQIQMTAVHARDARPPPAVAIPRAARHGLGNPVLQGYMEGIGATLAEYGQALAMRDALIVTLDQFLADWDAWICPVAPAPAFRHLDTLSWRGQITAQVQVDGTTLPYSIASCAYTDPLNTTGNPVVVLPLTRQPAALPIGVQVVGRRWRDMELLAVAETLTTITGDWVSPPGY